jgi:hypothetical protein
MKPMVDEEERYKQQAASSSNATLTTTAAISPAFPQTYPPSHSHSNTTTQGWDNLLLPQSHFLQNTRPETFGYDDTFPMILYEQHPEVAGFNWDAVLPE